MGKRAHCEVFRRHSDVPPFLQPPPSPSDRRGLTNRMSSLLQKFNVQISKFQIDGLEVFVSNRKKNKGLSGKTLV